MNLNCVTLARLLVVSLTLTTGFGVAVGQSNTPAGAATPPVKGEAVIKVLLENDRVRVYEATFAPGDVSPRRFRVNRVVHYLSPGAFHFTYADGKTDDRMFQAGDVVWFEPGEFAVKSNGDTTVRVFVTELK